MALKAHLFVCTNGPDREGKCGSKGAEELRSQVKKYCSGQPWAKEVRINSSGCLGHCEKGISAVLYPQGQWMFDLKKEDAAKLCDLVENSAK